MTYQQMCCYFKKAVCYKSVNRSVESLLDTSVEIGNIATEVNSGININRGYGTVGTVILYNTRTA